MLRNNQMETELKMNLHIIKENRRSLTLRVLSDGTLEVKAPRRMNRAEILSFVESKNSWIRKKLAMVQRQQVELSENPPLSDAEIRQLQKKARQIFKERADHYAPIVGTEYGKITVRRQQSRFGSCSAKGNLNFNLALMLAPMEILDYVVVHELCHRLEMNHSERFWNHVARVCPYYKAAKKWLKEHGTVLISRVASAST